MGAAGVIQTGLGIEEVPALIDIQNMLGGGAVAVVDVFVIVAAGRIMYAAVLQISENAEARQDGIRCLEEDAAVEFGRVGIVILIASVCEDALGKLLVGGVDQIAEMVAEELLHGQAGNGVPVAASDSEVGYQAEAILIQALLADEIAAFDAGSRFILEYRDAVFDEFVVVAEFLIIAVARGIMGDGGEIQPFPQPGREAERYSGAIVVFGKRNASEDESQNRCKSSTDRIFGWPFGCGFSGETVGRRLFFRDRTKRKTFNGCGTGKGGRRNFTFLTKGSAESNCYRKGKRGLKESRYGGKKNNLGTGFR